MPVLVVTYRAREPLVKNGGTTYIFVADGIQAALAQAKAAASDKDVAVIGGGGRGGRLGRQGGAAARLYPAVDQAGLIDELRIQRVPVLLADGTSLFDRLSPEQATLESARVIDASGAMHLTFKVVA